jgi:6-pyruvoyl-tetrahydropterin synthase
VFTTRVVRQIEAAHHNGPEGSKCYTNHGHSWKILVEVQVEDRKVNDSEYGWSVDFHAIKEVIDFYDHKDLNAEFFDTPPSAENLARNLWFRIFQETGFQPTFVEVHEGSGNSVRFSNP